MFAFMKRVFYEAQPSLSRKSMLPPELQMEKRIVLHRMEQDLGMEGKRGRSHVSSAGEVLSHLLFTLWY